MEENMTSRLTIVFEIGVDDEGEPIFRNKTFSNVNEAASNEQLVQFAQALTSLQIHPAFGVTRNNSVVLA